MLETIIMTIIYNLIGLGIIGVGTKMKTYHNPGGNHV